MEEEERIGKKGKMKIDKEKKWRRRIRGGRVAGEKEEEGKRGLKKKEAERRKK